MSVVNTSGREAPTASSSRAAEGPIADGWERGLLDVGAQARMRGLATACPRCVRGCPCLTAGIERIGHITSDGSSPTAASPPPVRELWTPRPWRRGESGRLHFLRYRPHEGGELTRDGRAGDGRLLAPCGERAVARRQAALRLPRDLAHLGRHALELDQLRRPDPRRMP